MYNRQIHKVDNVLIKCFIYKYFDKEDLSQESLAYLETQEKRLRILYPKDHGRLDLLREIKTCFEFSLFEFRPHIKRVLLKLNSLNKNKEEYRLAMNIKEVKAIEKKSKSKNILQYVYKETNHYIKLDTDVEIDPKHIETKVRDFLETEYDTQKEEGITKTRFMKTRDTCFSYLEEIVLEKSKELQLKVNYNPNTKHFNPETKQHVEVAM